MFLLPFIDIATGKHHTPIELTILVQIIKSMSPYASVFIRGFVNIHLKPT